MPGKKLVQFGAGNIGRSFIGQLFAAGGYEVVFVDVNRHLVELLNDQREYRVVIKRNDTRDETIVVEGVRALDGRSPELISSEIADCSLISTSVGKGALASVFPVIAAGLVERRARLGDVPVDIVIAENIRGAAAWFLEELTKSLPNSFPLSRLVGLVETSIGKMVPIMTDEELKRDPLCLFAEEYNTLILDRWAFRSPVPDVPGVKSVGNIAAYVDRKLFIHNLGHAAAAYLGYVRNPTFKYLWEVLEASEVLSGVEAAMHEAAVALNREYPADLPLDELERHIADLIERFRNRSLGDTIYRVGRDLYRKLDREDRLIGAMLLAARHTLPINGIASAAAAAISFQGKDDHGLLYPADARFVAEELPKGVPAILRTVCKLDPEHPVEGRVFRVILSA